MKELSRKSKAVWAKAFLKKPLKTKYLFRLIGDAWQMRVKIDEEKRHTKIEQDQKLRRL